MSGVRTGSRLDQLQQLRRRVTVQLEYARRTGQPTDRLLELAQHVDAEITAEAALLPPSTAPAAAPAAEQPPRPRPSAVRAWAVATGLLPAGQARGRLPNTVVTAYDAHHRLDSIIRKAGTP
jgi:hypothetical protein